MKVVCLSELKKCKNSYLGKVRRKCRLRLNNYKSAHKSFKNKIRGTGNLFHEHYIQNEHEGKDNWRLKYRLTLNLYKSAYKYFKR